MRKIGRWWDEGYEQKKEGSKKGTKGMEEKRIKETVLQGEEIGI